MAIQIKAGRVNQRQMDVVAALRKLGYPDDVVMGYSSVPEAVRASYPRNHIICAALAGSARPRLLRLLETKGYDIGAFLASVDDDPHMEDGERLRGLTRTTTSGRRPMFSKKRLALEGFLRLQRARFGADVLRYLDVGCGDGRKTKITADALAVDEAFGVDLPQWGPYTRDRNCEFRSYDGEMLPHATAMIDLVSMYMVLHHLEQPHTVLSEVARVLRPGGWLLLEEHDVMSREDHMLATLEHDLHEARDDAPCAPGRPHRLYDRYQVEAMLHYHGFRLVAWSFVHEAVRADVKPTRAYFALFVKEEILRGADG